jgi:hypothetical protein
MIKFFRKVRQKMLTENKFSKYLIYAIGEIILVVIGILIALQINNNNEARKVKEGEIKLYKNAILDLQEEAIGIEFNIKTFKAYQDAYYEIYQESIGQTITKPIEYSNLVWSNYFRALIEEKYGANLGDLENEIVQQLFRDLIWREKLTIEAMNEWNDTKFKSVRPFLSKYGISNVDTIYSDARYEYMKLKNASFVDPVKLRARYGTEEFNQILYDGKYSSSWAIRCLENLKFANENLILGLKAAIDGDMDTLEKIKPIDSYY